MADAAMITSVLRGGPASKAGLRAHDFILEVDEQSVTGLSGEALVERLRGRGGTQVALTLKRQEETFEVSIRRDAVTVKNQQVHSELCDTAQLQRALSGKTSHLLRGAAS